MLSFDGLEAAKQGFSDGCGQHRIAILVAFAGADRDLFLSEVDVFHPQAAAFHESKSGAIEKHCPHPWDSVHTDQEALDLLLGEDHWQACWFLGSNNSLNEANLLFQNLMVEKQ